MSTDQWSREISDSYCVSAPSHIQQLLGYFRWRDWALKAVGLVEYGRLCAWVLAVISHQVIQ